MNTATVTTSVSPEASNRTCNDLKRNFLAPFWSLFSEHYPFKSITTLCFVDAYWAKDEGAITENEYIAHLTAHFGDIRHPPNKERPDDICQETLYEPFAGSIRKLALENLYRPVQILDTQAYEQLFRSCIERKPDDVKAKLCDIQKSNPDIVPFNPLAVLAAREGLGEILQLCFERGVTWDRYLARACYEGSLHHPEVGKVIAPHAKVITRLTEGRKDPDGNYTPEQLEEW